MTGLCRALSCSTWADHADPVANSSKIFGKFNDTLASLFPFESTNTY